MGSRTASPLHEASSAVDSSRKRVCRACDRCRLKKSRCDGLTPCSRCKTDDMICAFSERKRSQDRVYPKGYVEMLEHQQIQLVSGVQELYRRLQNGEDWTGPALDTTSRGTPLTHDILDRLGVAQQVDIRESKQTQELDPYQQILSSRSASLAQQGPTFQNPSNYNQISSFSGSMTMQFTPDPTMTNSHAHRLSTSSVMTSSHSVYGDASHLPNPEMQAVPGLYKEMIPGQIEQSNANAMELSPFSGNMMNVNVQALMNLQARIQQDAAMEGINPNLTVKRPSAQEILMHFYQQNPYP